MSFADSHRNRRLARVFAAACALPGLLFLAGCGKVTSTEIEDIGGSDVATIELRIEASAKSVEVGGQVKLTVHAVDKNGTNAPEGILVYLTQEPPLGQINPPSAPTSAGKATAAFIAGAQTGKTLVKATYGTASAQTEITVAARPDPTPPPPTPPPPGPGPGGDDINPAEVTWSDANITSWKITAKMSNLAILRDHSPGCQTNRPSDPPCQGGREPVGPCIYFDFSHPSYWPVFNNLIGSHFVLGKVNGRWYGGVWDLVRPGRTFFRNTEQCAENSAQFIQANGDVRGVHFNKGDDIGFVFTPIARGQRPANNPQERSRIHKLSYPF